jgi:CRP-like cAMP-binding protein
MPATEREWGEWTGRLSVLSPLPPAEACAVTIVVPELEPISLMADQIECEAFTLPTGARVFERGQPAQAIYGVRRGVIELLGEQRERLCYRHGELFSYQDIVRQEGTHGSHAVARTPVEVLRMDRHRFLNLLHNHPTLALLLIGQQHTRLREQRSSGSYCY